MTKVALGMRTQTKACVHRHILAYVVRVSEAYERLVFCNNG